MNYIFGAIIFGFLILALTGLGILTTAIFEIKQGTIAKTIAGTQDPKIVEYVTNKPTNATYTDDMRKAEKTAIPTAPSTSIDEGTGEYIIKLKDPNLTVAKISLITFWILIAIGVISIPFLRN